MTKEFIYDSTDWGLGTLSENELTLSGRKLKYCLDNLPQLPGKILEVGCARGQFIRSIKQARPEWQAFGCDINSKAIEANQDAPSDGVEYAVGNAYQLPYADGFFDAVVFFDLMEHLDFPERFLSELNRVIKKGGVVHGYIPCEGQPGTLHWLLWKIKCGHDLKKKHRGHIQRFTIDDCTDLADFAGFQKNNKQCSGYLIEQFLDIIFYFLLEFNGAKGLVWKAHSKKEGESGSLLVRILAALRDFAFFLGYIEGKLFSFIPFSLGLHLTAQKR